MQAPIKTPNALVKYSPIITNADTTIREVIAKMKYVMMAITTHACM